MSSVRGPGRPPGAPAPRREQLIEVTIDLVAEEGYSAATLGRVAAAAQLSKASVLHHVDSVAALIRAAHDHVLDSMVMAVTEAIEAVPAGEGPAAYVTAMIGYFREHPRHTRMLSEALVHFQEPAHSRQRWEPLAELLDQARTARGLSAGPDLRTAAVAVGGAIDAIVRERLIDPDYDSAAAAGQLADAIDLHALS